MTDPAGLARAEKAAMTLATRLFDAGLYEHRGIDPIPWMALVKVAAQDILKAEVASAVAGERERELSMDEVIAEVAEWPTTSETPGVARDYELDEWIGMARALRASSSAAPGGSK